MGAFLILEKFFSRSSFYDIGCFSILASRTHLDGTITSDNILRRSNIDIIIFSLMKVSRGIFSVVPGFHL